MHSERTARAIWRRLQAVLKAALQLAAVLLLPCLSAPAPAQEEQAHEYVVKAALLANFAMYTEWPLPLGDALEFCVLGKDPFGTLLEINTQRKRPQGKPIAIRRLTPGAELKGCHLLFVPEAEKDSFYRVAPAIRQSAILTVTDAQEMDDKLPMIMITVVPEARHFTFDINLSAARLAGLSFSSKLLRLARNVK